MLLAIDSNIFIYVFERNVEYWQSALRVLQVVETGKYSGTASKLTYLEILSDSKLSSQRLKIVDNFLADTRVNFVSVAESVLRRAAELRRKNNKLKTPDAIHLASAIENKANYFITNDQYLLRLKIKDLKLISLSDIDKILPDSI